MKRILAVLTLCVLSVNAGQPKEIIALKSYIRDAHATQFRRSCEKLSMTPEQTTTLMTLAHKAKEQRLLELDQMGVNTIHKKKIASGCGAATLGVGAVALAIVTSVLTSLLCYDNYKNTPGPKICNVANNVVAVLNATKIIPIAKGLHPLYDPTNPGDAYIFHSDKQQTLSSIAFFSAATVFFATSAGLLFQEAYDRIKLGWNYKIHLQRQVQNLDRIITCLQTYTTPLDIKEQV
jgi:hypothetical protein